MPESRILILSLLKDQLKPAQTSVNQLSEPVAQLVICVSRTKVLGLTPRKHTYWWNLQFKLSICQMHTCKWLQASLRCLDAGTRPSDINKNKKFILCAPYSYRIGCVLVSVNFIIYYAFHPLTPGLFGHLEMLSWSAVCRSSRNDHYPPRITKKGLQTPEAVRES